MQLKSNNYDIFSSKYTKKCIQNVTNHIAAIEHNVRGKEQQLGV